MCTGAAPHSQMHPAQILVGLAGGELSLEWPPAIERTLRRVGKACLAYDASARPTFEQVVHLLRKALRRATGGPATAATAAGAGGSVQPPGGGGELRHAPSKAFDIRTCSASRVSEGTHTSSDIFASMDDSSRLAPPFT
jgi:hypothetical protein